MYWLEQVRENKIGQAVVAALGTLTLAYLLLTQSPFAAIGLVLAVAAFVLVTRKPEWGLYLMVLSVPGQTDTSLMLGGSRVTFTQASVLLALVGWFGSRVIYRRPFVPQPMPRLLPFYGLYLGVMVLSLTVARSTSEGLNELSRWLITGFAYLLAVSVIETRRQMWGLIVCLCAGAVVEAALGIAQSRLNLGPESYAISETLSRAFGTFSMPNSYAGYLEMALPMLVAMTLLVLANRNVLARRWLDREGQPREQERQNLLKQYWLLVVLLPATVLVVLGVLFSFSRGAWLGLAVAAVVMILLKGKKAAPIVILGGGLVLFVVLGLQTGAIPAATFGRLTSIGDQFWPFDVRGVDVTDDNFAIVERMAMWQAGGNMFLSDPLLGVGIGNYNERYTEFSTPYWPDTRGHAHNYYIHAAAETGILGLAAYLLLLLAALAQGLRAALTTPDLALRQVAWGAFGVISAVAVHNIVEDLHVLSMGIQWSAMLALFYLVGKLGKTSPKDTKTPS